MDTLLDISLVEGYTSKSQMARVITEGWTSQNMYCPICGWPTILKFPNNKVVADFYCPNCHTEFELKSKNGTIGTKIPDGAYSTFVQRITSNNNPDFFVMSYSFSRMRVLDMYFIPKFFFVPELVEKRKPLTENARRAGWIGCNILFDKIPGQGRIPIVQEGVFLDKEHVIDHVKYAQRLRFDNIEVRGWILDILNCVNQIQDNVFSLDMIYQFENELAIKHPDNHNIRPKIRQQLQQLRDRGVISFLGGGRYRKNV